MEEQIPEKDIKCCYNCIWYEKRTGFCRRNPPDVQFQYINRTAYPTAVFPKISVPNLDWCGEFKKADDKKLL